MTSNNADLYHQLLKTGAPALPDNYFYKVWQNKKKAQYLYLERETESSRALCVEIRKKTWGGLFSVSALSNRYWYMSQRDLNYPYSDDNSTLLSRGWIIEEDLDGTYRLAHIALLCEQANDDRIAKQDNTEDLSTRRISAFLNKRIP